MTKSDEALSGQPMAMREGLVTGQVSAALHWVRRQIEIHRARRRLEALPDRMLRDIGIHRSMINSVTRHGIRR